MATQGSGAELMELVTQMKSTIQEHFLPTMQALHDKVQTETERAGDWLNDVKHAAEEAQPVLHESFQTAQQKIEEMEGIVKTEVDETAQAITTYVGYVHEVKGHAHDLLNTALAHAADVTEKLHAADETHASVGDTISHAMGDWTSQVQQHLTTLEGHHHTIADALHAFNEHANTHVNDLTTKLQHTGEFVTEHVSTTVQLHVTNTGELLEHTKDHYISQVGEALGGHVGDVMGHVQGFVQTGEQLGHVFDGGLGDVLQKVDEVSHLIESIKPVIDLAKKLS
jgi:gas vesicle protein